MIGKSIYMGMTEQEEVKVNTVKLPPCIAYEYCEKDEQADDYAGCPQIITDAGFK
jgi:hypothetical protein